MNNYCTLYDNSFECKIFSKCEISLATNNAQINNSQSSFIIVVIIPLAGLGTRLLPLTSVFAKELLPINGKPGLEYILDECIEAGIKQFIFIILTKVH